MIVQLLFAGLFYLSPIDGKIEGNYLAYLHSNKVIVEVWGEQIDAVASIANTEGFCEVSRSKNKLVLSYQHDKELRFHLWKLGQDAAVERIQPFPYTITLVNQRGELLCEHIE